MFAGMLIGKEIVVLACKDKTITGIQGKVLDETKNTLLVLTPQMRQLRIPKSIVTISLEARPSNLTLDGAKLIGTPAERIKG